MPFLIYGAYGYTGSLIARAAVEAGITPTLVGRSGSRARTPAEEFVLPYLIFELSDTEALDAALDDTQLVLHCAGPFAHTAEPMVKGYMRTATDYLDITGEIEVFEMLATEPVKQFLKRRVQQGDPGPTAEERAQGKSVVWGEVLNEAEEHAMARLHGPETYALPCARRRRPCSARSMAEGGAGERSGSGRGTWA